MIRSCQVGVRGVWGQGQRGVLGSGVRGVWVRGRGSLGQGWGSGVYRKGVLHNDDMCMTPLGRPDFVVLGLKIQELRQLWNYTCVLFDSVANLIQIKWWVKMTQKKLGFHCGYDVQAFDKKNLNMAKMTSTCFATGESSHVQLWGQSTGNSSFQAQAPSPARKNTARRWVVLN